MTNLLVKLFVKNHEQYENTKVRTAYGVMASIVGICCNILLFLIKIVVGAFLKSVSVTADAFNNLSDAASSVISFIGAKMAGKPADEEHPFGHGRMEYISALIVSFLVIQVGLSFFQSSLNKIKNPSEISFSIISVGILSLSVGIKLWLGCFNRRLGKKINSSVMKATAADAFGDVLTTSATILSIFICHFTKVNIDGFMGLLVSGLVMWSGINIARETLEPLIGGRVDPKLCQEITRLVESYDGIVGTHDLIVHNYGPNKSLASIHAEVPNNVNIEVSHEIIDKAEREVSKKLNVFLVIHMDPVETQNETVLQFKQMVQEVVKEIDSHLSFHDFRLVDGKEHINLIFDLVVPFTYNANKQTEILAEVAETISKRDQRCQCIITIENSYTSGQNKKV